VEGQIAGIRYLSKSKKIMAIDTKRIVLWCADAPNQKALAVKIAAQFNLAGIVMDQKKPVSGNSKATKLISKIWDRLRFHKIYNSWKSLQQFYQQYYPSWPQVPVLRVASINSAETERFTREIQPTLIMVSGTSLVKAHLLTVPASIGIINLHTGLSPYVKGGPNCTNWCIANNEWQLVGNTVMWLNAGIDSGNIITTECIDIRKASNLSEAHKIVMEHAHDLYLRAVNYLLSTDPPFNAVPQNSLGQGKLFLTKMWTAEMRKNLLKNWSGRQGITLSAQPVTIPLSTERGAQ
jgi:methionyl-tRNA formyltransferase